MLDNLRHNIKLFTNFFNLSDWVLAARTWSVWVLVKLPILPEQATTFVERHLVMVIVCSTFDFLKLKNFMAYAKKYLYIFLYFNA